MELRLSIIIPFYNVERYISECLDSVFDQDIPLTEYEVICVNDGSPDRSRDIVLDYMGRYPNLRLIEHDRNRKLGAARNTGRSIANGKYIWNVDSDDKIVSNCLSKMLQLCECYKLDILEFRPLSFLCDEIKKLPYVPTTEIPLAGLDYLEQLSSYEVSQMSSVWRRIIRRAFLEENNLYSPEINHGEDVPFSFKSLVLAKRFMSISDICYQYRSNPEALTGIKWQPTANSLYEKCIYNAKLIYEVYKTVPKGYPNVSESFKKAASYTLSRLTSFYNKMTNVEQKLFRNKCRESLFTDLFVLHLLSRKRKLHFFVWLTGFSSRPGN